MILSQSTSKQCLQANVINKNIRSVLKSTIILHIIAFEDTRRVYIESFVTSFQPLHHVNMFSGTL